MPLPSGYTSAQAETSPRGRQRVFTWIRKQTFTNPITADDDGYLTTTAGPNTTTSTPAFNGAISTGVPDFPRNVVITVTHATSVVALSGVITGFDTLGLPITEAWSVTATGTSKVFTGSKSFKKVTSVTIVAAADASADSVIIGTGVKLGLDTTNALASAVKETSAGSVVTNGTLVAASTSASADRYGTYSPSSAPNGSTAYQVWYLVDDFSNM